MPYEQKHTRLNTTTGEWEETSTRRYSRRVPAEAFTILLHPVADTLLALTHARDFHVLLVLCEVMEYNTNRCPLLAGQRQQLMTRLHMSSQHLANSLARLRAAGIIDGRRGETRINPAVAWKGTSAARLALLTELMSPNPLPASTFDNQP